MRCVGTQLDTTSTLANKTKRKINTNSTSTHSFLRALLLAAVGVAIVAGGCGVTGAAPESPLLRLVGLRGQLRQGLRAQRACA